MKRRERGDDYAGKHFPYPLPPSPSPLLKTREGGVGMTQVPTLSREESVVVMKQLGCFEPRSLHDCADAIDEAGIGVKQLLMVCEMAKQGGKTITHESFTDGLRSYGL